MRMGILLVLLLGILLITPVFAQDDVILLLPEIEIRGEAAAPTAIIAMSRTLPDYMPTSIAKDYTSDLVLIDEDLFAPAEEELQPMDMGDIRDILAIERIPQTN